MDSITGLPTRSRAEQALLATQESDREWHVTVFVLERLHLIQSRYDQDAADSVLVRFCQQLRQRLGDTDRLYRWGPAAFIGIFERRLTTNEFRAEMSGVIPSKLESIVHFGARTALFTTTCNWNTFPILSNQPIESLVHKIDVFLADSMRILGTA